MVGVIPARAVLLLTGALALAACDPAGPAGVRLIPQGTPAETAAGDGAPLDAMRPDASLMTAVRPCMPAISPRRSVRRAHAPAMPVQTRRKAPFWRQVVRLRIPAGWTPMATAMPARGIQRRFGAPVPADAQGALWHPSPNFGPRRGSATVSLIVIHYTAMAGAEAALERLCDPAFEVSAHYLIGADGTLWQMVREAERAWHAGQGLWGGTDDVNSRSIGIELDNLGDQSFPAAQMGRLRTLLAEVMARHALPPESVIGHSDMAPERKYDPGRQFDWRGLAAAGLSVWPAPLGSEPSPDPRQFEADACAFGYPQAEPDALLDAVRQRFRPGATGPLCAADMAIVADLAHRFPVDRSVRNA